MKRSLFRIKQGNLNVVRDNTFTTSKAIVDYMVNMGIKNTLEGSYSYSFDELEEEMNISVVDIIKMQELITELGSNREEVAELEVTDDNVFRFYFYTDYCINI